MKLRTATNRTVRYPDRPGDGLVWIEFASRAGSRDPSVLEKEVEALAAAGLLVQLELGLPVAKLLNVSGLVFDANGNLVDPDAASPALNLLGLLTDDDTGFTPERVVRQALEDASPGAKERFANAPDELAKIQSFIHAIGAVDNAHPLNKPWIHLTMDHPTGRSEVPARDRVTEQWPWLSEQTLWWMDGPEADERHLFRLSSPDGETKGATNGERSVLVPLPVTRGDVATTAAEAHGTRAILSTAGDRSQVGFSLPTPPPTAGSDPEAGASCREILDATWAFIDAHAT